MRRILTCIVLCCISWMAYGQTDNEKQSALIADMETYGSAVRDIVRNKDYAKGIATVSALIARCEAKQAYPPKNLASYYSLRAQGRLRQQQYPQSVDDSRQALALLEKAGEEGKTDLSGAWYELSLAYYYWKKPDEAMRAADNCVQTALDYYGPHHSVTMDAYSLRSNYAGFYNKKDVALSDRQAVFSIIQKNVERNFAYLTSSERAAYWNKHLPETTVMFAFAHKMAEYDSGFTDDLFNQQLMAKGLLLTAESALQRTIDSNHQMNETYQQIRRLRQVAENVKTLPKDADAATLEADRLERQLGMSANSLSRFLDFLKVHVDDVRQHLAPSDIAVEFVDYRLGKDSTMYAALVLSPRWKHVRFIPLAESKEITAHSDNLAPYIWQPVINALGYTPENIFFAPSGLLYQYPVESQVLANGKLMCETFNMYRLSSTRWLAYKGDGTKGKDAVIYGGLAYDAEGVNTPSGKTRGAEVGIPFLEGTEVETERITQVINSAGLADLHAAALYGENGTEASLKAFSGQQKRILHIATHGFYIEDNQPSSTPDKALMRCGLFFAGADNSWQSKQIVPGADDGILTAQEISSLDLRGLELTALSACQTGQGDITADGVFGLQRGFKKAGAQSILMSLWKVDDDATCLLMTEFYKNWISGGMRKLPALEKAKQTVRSHKEKGWDNPKYWATFILLDAF